MLDDLGLLVARGVLGASFAAHGAQKAFGWFEGPGPEGAAKVLHSLGFKPGEQFAKSASYSELTAGTLIALGLGGPIGPALLLSTMLVAQMSVHAKNGYFAGKNGVELGVMYSAGALALAASGYGALSLDRAIGLQNAFGNPFFKTLVIGGAVAVGYAILGQRDLSPPAGTLATPTIQGRRRNGVPAASPAPANN